MGRVESPVARAAVSRQAHQRQGPRCPRPASASNRQAYGLACLAGWHRTRRPTRRLKCPRLNRLRPIPQSSNRMMPGLPSWPGPRRLQTRRVLDLGQTADSPDVVGLGPVGVRPAGPGSPRQQFNAVDATSLRFEWRFVLESSGHCKGLVGQLPGIGCRWPSKSPSPRPPSWCLLKVTSPARSRRSNFVLTQEFHFF